MTPERIHYLWDRLARAFARSEVMTNAQRKDLQDFILGHKDLPQDLKTAVGKFANGSLNPEELRKGYGSAKTTTLDLATHRAAMAPKKTAQDFVDQRIKAIIG